MSESKLDTIAIGVRWIWGPLSRLVFPEMFVSFARGKGKFSRWSDRLKFNFELAKVCIKVQTDCEYIKISPKQPSIGEKNLLELQQKYPDLFRTYHTVEPYTSVKTLYPYYIASRPVTRAEFREFAETENYTTLAEKENGSYMPEIGTSDYCRVNGISWKNPGFGRAENYEDLCPVVCVSWHDALRYVQWLNKTRVCPKGYIFALPSEVQWEYACRANSRDSYFWGNGEKEGAQFLNALDHGSYKGSDHVFPYNDSYKYTSPVGTLSPNENHLYDMLGNVFEWCFDAYDTEYYAYLANCREDPWRQPETEAPTDRVIRGGSWASGPFFCRCAYRRSLFENSAAADIGFRIAVVQKKSLPEKVCRLFLG